jgi:hypothetical protein
MKKSAFISGTISVMLLAAGLLFKMHHLAGAGVLIMSGILLTMISLLLTAVYLVRANSKYKNVYLYWAVSTSIMIVGIVFKVQHYPGSLVIQSIGTGLFIIFTILLALKLYKS